eukprot:scaffold23463_cov59-Phaeocystis_antarctica.AAC.5
MWARAAQLLVDLIRAEHKAHGCTREADGRDLALGQGHRGSSSDVLRGPLIRVWRDRLRLKCELLHPQPHAREFGDERRALRVEYSVRGDLNGK